MTQAPFSIVNLRDGARRDVESFLLKNDSFPIIENAYLFRGRIQKRSSYQTIGTNTGRLRWQIGTTGASPFVFTLPDIPITSSIVQFSIGSVFFTDPGGASPVNLLSTNGAYSGTLDRTTGVVTLNHPVILATAVFYYPGLPVMGLKVREQIAINDELLLGFDTRYSYLFDSVSNDFIGANTYKFQAPAVAGPVFTWHGANSDLFWTVNYFNVLWASNNNSGLNSYTISAGTDAIPSVLTIGVGHNVQVNDVVMVVNTSTSNTLNGRTFQVSVVGAGTVTINNTVAPGGGAFSGVLVVLNRNVNSIAGTTNGDAIKWFDGPGTGTGWVNFIPPLNAATPQNLLRGALIILPYKDRLVVLNTYESSGLNAVVNFPQRARWCQNGTPFFTEDNAATPVEYLLPTNENANFDSWFDQVTGKGGFVDAPTDEIIVSAEFIKDTLIVYFERSTWQLVYTGNEVLPFVWQKINTELGSESTFSIVPFDRGVFAVGNYGIITTDSVNVVRLDEKIPDEVFQIQNINNGVKRVYGIRDFNAQLVYWTYPIISDEDDDVTSYTLTFPNQVLFYNYLDGSWAETDDTFTCFGYWQKFTDLTWADLTRSWNTTNFSWNSQVLQAKYPDVVAGNQRGFVFVFSQLQNLGQNAPSLEISNFSVNTITIPDHNLVNGQYILITACTGFTSANNVIFKITNATANTFDLDPVVNATGYTGGGLITAIPNLDILTKEFNPFYEQGKSVRINYIDILMDRTDAGQFTLNTYINSNVSVPVNSQTILTTTESVQPIYAGQTRIWHRIFPDIVGSFFQLQVTLSDTQIRDLEIATSNIRIHALIMYVSPIGRVPYDF